MTPGWPQVPYLGPDDLLETTLADRNRIFNLGYYTWVEQQGVPVEAFERRRAQGFWSELRQTASASRCATRGR